MRGRRPPGARLLRLYPGQWRARYETEVLAVLQDMHIGLPARADLVRGAIDAHLHAHSSVPAIAAIGAGGLWTIAGVAVLAQPAPPDWPGHLVDLLPLTVAAVLLGLIAIVGCWARQSDDMGRPGTAAVLFATIGHVGWAVALAATIANGVSGSVVVAAQTSGLIGCVVVGIGLVRSDDLAIGSAILLASALMLVGWPAAWLVFGLAWTFVGAMLIARSDPAYPSSRFA